MLGGFIPIFAQSVLGDSTGIAQFMLNAGSTIVFTMIIAMRMPSKEPRYNWGNLAMHVIMMYFYFVGLLLSPRVGREDSAFEDVDLIDRTLVGCQLLLCLYLVGVSLIDWKGGLRIQLTSADAYLDA